MGSKRKMIDNELEEDSQLVEIVHDDRRKNKEENNDAL